jgi:hypothetical protein
MAPFDRTLQRKPSEPEGLESSGTAGEATNDQVQFSSRGAIPGVAAGGGAAQQSASERVYGGGASSAVQLKKDLPKGDEGFKTMWEAHPHNYQDEEDQNVESPALLDEHGLPQAYENTCAIRLSIMLNNIGETITPAKAKASGMSRKPTYSKKTKQYYILSAAEMWKYLNASFRKADAVFPANGRHKTAEEFDTTFESSIKPAIAGKHGIVAFDKIFGYGGTGHVDLFDGENLSDSSSWYQSQRVQLWYI